MSEHGKIYQNLYKTCKLTIEFLRDNKDHLNIKLIPRKKKLEMYGIYMSGTRGKCN